MAWQQHVADVGLEIDPDTGRLAYREVIVSVMRQNGKTTLVLGVECQRCLFWSLTQPFGPEQRVAYTAQTGKDARTKFKEDHKPLIEKGALNHVVERFYMSDGNTSMIWKNGSRISVLDNTPSAGHGKTLDLAVIDEAFADKDNAREQALLPTMATRENSQIWNVSTAGTSESTYLLRKTEIGRAAVNAGKNTGVAYFEWSIPEDEDVDDPAVWAHRMPAHGVTIDDDFISHARQTMTDGDYRRAIGNQWTETEERLIPAEWWRAVITRDKVVPSVYVIDATVDRDSAVVVKAGGTGVQLVAVRPGVDWLESAFDKVEPRLPIAVDKSGPASGQADRLEAAGHAVVRYDSLQVRKACGRFFDAVADQKIAVTQDDRLDVAVANAARRSTSDSWAWHREAPGGELLVAVSIAYDQAQVSWEPMIGSV